MDQQRQRIQEDLRGLIHGDVRCDDITCELYASDASLFQIKPLGVVRPRTTADVSAVLKYASQNRLPVHARGAGTGLAGESLGAGLVVDFSRYMRRILDIGKEQVRVQPGVVHSRLNEELRKHGKIFGPDPAMSQVTTMGSVIAIDNSGSHWLAYGSARRHVRSLEVVLADGTVMEVGREQLETDPLLLDTMPALLRRREIVQQVAELCDAHAGLIAKHRPQTLVNRSGYELATIWDGATLDLAKLICGSEGTLALITAATVDIQDFPRHKAAAILLFDSLEKAVQAVPELIELQPCALDLLDRRHLSLACEAEPRFAPLLPTTAECLLLIEFAGDELRVQQDHLRRAVDLIWKKSQLAFDARIAADLEELRFFWRLPRRVMPILQRTRGSARPVPFVEDVAVPPAKLGEYLVSLQNILKQHQVAASLYGHVGHGQLHVRPFLDLMNPTDIAKLDAIASDICDATLAVNGTISGEHGDGLSRTPFVARQYGALYPVLKQVKQIFDPLGILNPGKVIALEDSNPSLSTALRPRQARLADLTASSLTAVEAVPEQDSTADVVAEPTKTLIELQLNWQVADLLNETKTCNGCGLCRTQLAEHRMCPTFRVGPAEESSPRAKANLLRGIVTGQLNPQLLSSQELKEVADLCVHCHQCRRECPTNVDIPKLMLEAKANYVATNGLRLNEWVFANLDRVARWGSRAPRLANWLLGNRQMRWLLERFLGLAHNRKLPRFAKVNFQNWAQKRGLTRLQRRGERKVLLIADTSVNYFDPQLGQAVVSVLEHNGVTVYVPPEPIHVGMPLITLGAVAQAKQLASKNVALLAEAIRQGYKIVCVEPSSVLGLQQEYGHLIDDEEVGLIASHTVDVLEYLWQLHQHGDLQLDLQPVHATIAYHQPCHAKVTQTGAPGEQLLRLIAGLQVIRIDQGCSGMAGTYGLRKEHFRDSLRAGRPVIDAMRESSLQAGASECMACKMQLEQGANKVTMHPIKWLALSYGLLPELAEVWQQGTPERWVS